MNLDKKYWIPIAAATFFQVVAVSITYFLMTYHPDKFLEANPVSSYFFNTVGMLPSITFSVLLVFAFATAVPFLFKENMSIGTRALGIQAFLLFFTSLDGLHDLMVLMKFLGMP